eukprot:TRINITY_DN55984_c0_g1_i1.p1 TRINITY_DN55984_c0_g1~~TRINITY_DN55984_c0_g1_i1.p1  ORF type:complete len:192 (-),score=30.37 TRINITY_DN55984_c0_g1_i1:67-576(-)
MSASVIRSHFEMVDANKNGYIDKNEFRDLTYNLGFALNNVELDLAVSAIDSSGDGKINLPEFAEWFRSSPLVLGTGAAEDSKVWQMLTTATDYPDWMRWLIEQFKWYDKSKDGKISQSEFQLLCNDFPFASDVQWMQCDTDGDGLVDFNEFMRWAWDNYEHFEEKTNSS